MLTETEKQKISAEFLPTWNRAHVAARKKRGKLSKQFTNMNVAEVIRLYNEGKSYAEIGKMFGVSRQRVHLKIKGLIVPRTGKLLDHTDDSIVLDAFVHGVGAVNLGKCFNMTAQRVMDIWIQAGKPNRKNTRNLKRTTFPHNEAISFFKQGMPAVEIAKKFNVTASQIYLILKHGARPNHKNWRQK